MEESNNNNNQMANVRGELHIQKLRRKTERIRLEKEKYKVRLKSVHFRELVAIISLIVTGALFTVIIVIVFLFEWRCGVC